MKRPIVRATAAALLILAGATPLLAQEQVRQVAPSRVPSYWQLTNTSVNADVPNSGRNLNQPGCAAVTYMIGSDGQTRDVQLAKIVPESDLGPAAVSAVKDFRYAPTGTNRSGVAIRTYYVVQFNMPVDPAERARLTKLCDLPGYEAKP
jgi:outer membrane biosynthesis protein TonB